MWTHGTGQVPRMILHPRWELLTKSRLPIVRQWDKIGAEHLYLYAISFGESILSLYICIHKYIIYIYGIVYCICNRMYIYIHTYIYMYAFSCLEVIEMVSSLGDDLSSETSSRSARHWSVTCHRDLGKSEPPFAPHDGLSVWKCSAKNSSELQWIYDIYICIYI